MSAVSALVRVVLLLIVLCGLPVVVVLAVSEFRAVWAELTGGESEGGAGDCPVQPSNVRVLDY